MIVCQSGKTNNIFGVLPKLSNAEEFIGKMELNYFKYKPYFRVLEIPKNEAEFWQQNTSDAIIALVSLAKSNASFMNESFLTLTSKRDNGKQLMDKVRTRLLEVQLEDGKQKEEEKTRKMNMDSAKNTCTI